VSRIGNELQAWLDHLRLLFPPTGALVAGSGIGTWVEPLKAWNVTDVVMTEADAAQIERMKKAHALPERWDLLNALVWSEPGERTFYYASNPAVNGVVSPETFLSLWPNLTTHKTEVREAVTIAQLLDNVNIESHINWFVIDCLPALPLLQGAGGRLGQCDVVLARVLADEAEVSAPAALKFELDQWLAAEGFRNAAVFEEHHPQVLLALYVRDFRTSLDRERTGSEHLPQEYETLQSQLKSLEEERDEQAKLAQEQLGRIETLQSQLENIAKLVNENHAKEDKHLIAMENHISTAVTKGMANVIKQIESFVSLQYYLAHGMQPLNFHGWPISPDIALFLIQKIERYRYDLIIEFGSGTSTVLFAQALKSIEAAGVQLKGRKVVTFEHNENYYEQTLQTLTSQGLDKYVELVHAPLVEYTYEENVFMYYDCGQKLEELKAESGESRTSILLFVDGPPGATGPLARFPAVPHLLEQFPDQKIDLVLDDYYREDEKAIVRKWEELLQQRSIVYKTESIPSEKGLYFCQINQN